jgi:hypothetical protein
MAGQDIQKEIATIVKMFDEAEVVKKQLASDKSELKYVQETHKGLVETISRLKDRKAKAAEGARAAEFKASEIIRESNTICADERRRAVDNYEDAMKVCKDKVQEQKDKAIEWKNKADIEEERYNKTKKKMDKIKKDIA